MVSFTSQLSLQPQWSPETASALGWVHQVDFAASHEEVHAHQSITVRAPVIMAVQDLKGGRTQGSSRSLNLG
jgi:hypothetical protein